MKSLKDYILESQDYDYEHTVTMDDAQLKDFFGECESYIKGEEDRDQKAEYRAELKAIKKADKAEQWKKLTDSGIFHDAIGEVIEIKGDKLTYTTDY